MDYLARVAAETALPCVDPVATGVDALIEALPERQ
jgi:hypothetical protein